MIGKLLATLSFAALAGALRHDDEYVITGPDTVELRSVHTERRLSKQRQLTTFSSGTPRADFWEAWKQRDDSKTESSLWSNDLTLVTMKYLVLPIWWDGEDQVAPDLSNLATVLGEIQAYYSDMSWNKHTVSFEMAEQVVLTNVTRQNADFGNSQDAARAHVDSLGLTEFQDYDGIIIMYNLAAQGPFKGAGGWAGVNGNFVWLSIPGGFSAGRHEIGHNYGHHHHLSNSYLWRVDRSKKETAGYDGFDMMSGGNGYAVSDLAAAAKWNFNWITEDAIEHIQPEGSTGDCPTCLPSVSNLVLKPFDDRGVQPSSTNKMAVHIPVMGVGKKAYSYWLSYRSGNDGDAAIGLSIHVVELSFGGLFGATYDSLNFDAFGDTETRADSFVLPGTCYLVTPPGLLMDIDPRGPEQVLPKVCVDSLDSGNSITISVSFIDPDSPPSPTKTLSSTRDLGCSSAGASSGPTSVSVPFGAIHLLHYTGTGMGGEIDLSLCLEDGTPGSVKAYFYDTYPHAYMSLSSPPGYGAFQSLSVSELCDQTNSLKYASEYGETYVLIIGEDGATSTTSIQVKSICTVTKCHGSQYLDDTSGKCVNCPTGMVSDAGSTTIGACTSCEIDGFEVTHPKGSTCSWPEKSTTDLRTGREWRLITPNSLTAEWWVWDVKLLHFYSSEDCSEASKVDTSSATPFDSGNAGQGWDATRAFDDSESSTWGGRKDSRSIFFLGLTFAEDTTVRCIRLVQGSTHGAYQVTVQTRQTSGNWENVWVERDMVGDEHVIPFLAPPTESPTLSPTQSPTKNPSSPTHAPTKDTVEEPREGECENCEDGLFQKVRLYKSRNGRCVDRCVVSWLAWMLKVFGWDCKSCD